MSFNVNTELGLIQQRIELMIEAAISDFDSVTEINKLDFSLLGGKSLSLAAMILHDHPAVKAQITDKAALHSFLTKVGDDLHRGYNEAVEAHFN